MADGSKTLSRCSPAAPMEGQLFPREGGFMFHEFLLAASLSLSIRCASLILDCD